LIGGGQTKESAGGEINDKNEKWSSPSWGETKISFLYEFYGGRGETDERIVGLRELENLSRNFRRIKISILQKTKEKIERR